MARAKGTKSTGLDIPVANPGTTWTWIVSLLVTVLKPVLKIITPMIRDALEEQLLKLYAKAEATENPWDDFAVGFLLDILGIERPE